MFELGNVFFLASLAFALCGLGAAVAGAVFEA